MFQVRLMRDYHSLWFTLRVRPHNVRKRLLALPCVSICGNELKRVHLTCLTCWGRRVYYKKMPSKIPVWSYTLYVRRDRKRKTFKGKLLKFVLTIAEMLAR